MANVTFAYCDNSGTLHTAPIDAVIADITTILGRIGAESGITSGLAKLIVEKRAELEAAFEDLDLMTNHAKALAPEVVA